ncbi:HAMP domain-containing sensor histidine kinase [Nonomuraea sp. NPDC049784]|uniref:sensor histidine kinase n=1 Tax=Nonomuraea sp. NPDC049784 TaxID=3154361 RepID=UPI0033F7A53E
MIVFAVIGISLAILVRTNVQDSYFAETQRAATDWIASMRPGHIPPPSPTTSVNLLQLVDSHHRVVAASSAVAGKPPLSTVQPPADNRIQHLITGSQTEHVALAAIRVSPQEARLVWNGEPHVVYAGKELPPILAMHQLELATSAAVLLCAVVGTWMVWTVVGRTLRPVAAIRTKMSDISVSDLSQRVPEPQQDDEIGQLARTANQTLAQLEQAVNHQRNFASIVTHELKTPIAGLQAQLDEGLLYPDDVDARETIRTASATAQRLRAIIDDVLTFARIRTTAPEPPEEIDLSALVAEETANHIGTMPVLVHTTGEVKVLGNPLQLIRILNNLLVNAQRHAHTSVQVTVERTQDHAIMTVTDDGDGIAPQDRESVFEPFVRLADGRRRDSQGSGLGLAISREIAKAHSGTLTVEDSPRGARFVLKLPLMTSQVQVSAQT